MKDFKKRGKRLIVVGITMILLSIPNFYMASQSKAEADEIRKTNEARAELREEKASFNKTFALILICGGIISIAGGTYLIKKESY